MDLDKITILFYCRLEFAKREFKNTIIQKSSARLKKLKN